MSDLIYQQIRMALESGKLIQAIKLIRQVENLDLRAAKERVEGMVRDMRNEQNNNPFIQAKTDSEILEASSRPRAHSHSPARSGEYNVEGDLPTEAFLFFQKGKVDKGIKVIQEVKGVNKNSAKRLAKMFYQQHPEYTSKEIVSLMGSGVAVKDYSKSNTRHQNQSKSTNTTYKKKEKKGGNIFSTIVFVIILIQFIRAFID